MHENPKRLSFKHEEEVRLVYEALDDREVSMDILKCRNVFGVNMKVDLFDLIEDGQRDSRSKTYYCISPGRNSSSKKEILVEVLEIVMYISMKFG